MPKAARSGAFGAAVAVREWMEKTKTPGNVRTAATTRALVELQATAGHAGVSPWLERKTDSTTRALSPRGWAMAARRGQRSSAHPATSG